MKKNWLTLNSNTFLWIKNGKGLLYNTNNFQILRFNITRKIESICKMLLVTDNLYSVSISDSTLKDTEVKNWINSILIYGMGVYTPNENEEARPVSLKPLLKIQDDVERYKWEQSRDIQGSIINNLHEIAFYLNGSKNGDKHFYKQVLYPIVTAASIPYSDVLDFCKNARNPFLDNIIFLGALHLYANYNKLLFEMLQLEIPITAHVIVNDFYQNPDFYFNLAEQDKVSVRLLIGDVCNVRKNIFYNDKNVNYTFLIATGNDYDAVSEIIKKNKLESNFQIIPLYDNNLEFFKTSLFIGEEDFNDLKLTKRDVFVRQSLNINDFGKLTILPDGNAYANVNNPSIGTIKSLPADLIYNEFTNGKSWLNIRNKKPCNKCIYQWMCPSPSNYEVSIGRYNLCHLKP